MKEIASRLLQKTEEEIWETVSQRYIYQNVKYREMENKKIVLIAYD